MAQRNLFSRNWTFGSFKKLYLGNVNDDLGFEYEEETSVRYGCSATLHDEFWYFGGLDTTLRQVFRKKIHKKK